MYNCRLLFLPSSTSALVAVFLAGLTFGFLLFPFVIVLIFLLLFFLFFLYFCCLLLLFLFSFILLELFFCLFIIFNLFNFLRSPWCQVALLDGCHSLLYYFVGSSGPAIPHLQALRLQSLFWCPLSQFLYFSVILVFNNFFSSVLSKYLRNG